MIKKVIYFIIFFVVSIAFKTEFIQAEDFSDAMQIPINSDISGNVTEGERYEQNYYMFTTPENGYITLDFSTPLQSKKKGSAEITVVIQQYGDTIIEKRIIRVV